MGIPNQMPASKKFSDNCNSANCLTTHRPEITLLLYVRHVQKWDNLWTCLRQWISIFWICRGTSSWVGSWGFCHAAGCIVNEYLWMCTQDNENIAHTCMCVHYKIPYLQHIRVDALIGQTSCTASSRFKNKYCLITVSWSLRRSRSQESPPTHSKKYF